MAETKSTHLNLDKNQIELIDGTEIRSTNTKKTIKLGKKNDKITLVDNNQSIVKLETLAEKQPQCEPKPLQTSDMFDDLELIGNDDIKHHVAVIRDNGLKLLSSSETNDQMTSERHLSNKHKSQSQLTHSQPKPQTQSQPQSQSQPTQVIKTNIKRSDTSSRHSNISKNQNILDNRSELKSNKSLISNPVTPPLVKRPINDQYEQEIRQVNKRLDYIKDTRDPDVVSKNSSQALNFLPSFKQKHDTSFDMNPFDTYSQSDLKPNKISTNNSKELHMKKAQLLLKIERLKKRGYCPSKHFSIIDSYDDILSEKNRLEEQASLESSIQFQKNSMVMVSSLLEMVNNNYNNLFDLNLNGWSDSLHDNIDDYEPIFEELHDKYKESVQLAPEIKLLLMFFGSAFTYHISQLALKKAEQHIPGFNDIMKNNPQLQKAYTNAANQMFNQSTSNKNGGNGGGAGGLGGLMNAFVGGNNDSGGMLDMIGGLFGGNRQGSSPTIKPKPRTDINNNVQLKTPAGFDDLLKDMNLSHMSEATLKIDDDLTSYATNNKLKNVHVSSTKRAVKKN